MAGAPLYYSTKSGDFGGFEAAGVWAASATTIRVTSPIILSQSPRLALLHGTLRNKSSRQNVVLDTQGREKFVRKLQLDKPSFSLNIGSGDPVPQAGDLPLRGLTKALGALGFESLVIRDGTLLIRGDRGRSVTLHGVTAQFRGGRQRTSLAGRGSFLLNGEKISFDLSSQVRKQKPASGRIPFKLTLNSTGFSSHFSGHIDVLNGLRLAGNVSAKVANLRSLARMFRLSFPYGDGLRNFLVNGQLSWQGNQISFNKSVFVMDGNSATGALNLNISRPRPSIEGTLALSSLDLRKYLKSPRRTTKAEFLTRFLPKDSDTDLALIRHVNADLRISADKVLLGGLQTGRGAASVTLRDGKLLADIAELDLADGAGLARGQFTVDMAGSVPAYVLRGKLEKAGLRKLLQGVPGAALLPEQATLVFNFSALGLNSHQMMSTLAGKASVTVTEDAHIGVDLRPLLVSQSAGGDGKWPGKLAGKMPVKSGVAKFVVSGGKVSAKLTSCKSGDVNFSGQGTMDLASRLVDFNLSVWRVLPATSGGGRKNHPMVIDRAVRIHGPLRQPEIAVGRMHKEKRPVDRMFKSGTPPAAAAARDRG